MYRRSNSKELCLLQREQTLRGMQILSEKNHEYGKCYTCYRLTHNRSSQRYSFIAAFVKTLMRVIIHKLPPHIHQLCLPKKYRSHLCRHYISLVSGWMDMVDYGCLDLTQFGKVFMRVFGPITSTNLHINYFAKLEPWQCWNKFNSRILVTSMTYNKDAYTCHLLYMEERCFLCATGKQLCREKKS